jgi:NAD(P)-dependent dehydrogenase (short-subunit alcohol dehydrogenase family)
MARPGPAPKKRPLDGKVALVAGATRGAGRGIAAMLGEAGATVYCTGRSADGQAGMKGRPETVEETAADVTARGGRGIALRVDHEDGKQVRRLVRRIDEENPKGLDILVNDIWGGDPLTEWGKPFWTLDLDKGFEMLRRAVFTHIITARHATPLLLKKRGALFEVTDGNGYWYRGTLFYDLVKTTVIRLAFDFAQELGPRGAVAVAVTPGFLRSEAVLDHLGVTSKNWRDAVDKDPNFAASETPYFLGRAVAALAADPLLVEKSGRVFATWDLAEEYRFDDVDGTRPHWMRHFEKRYKMRMPVASDAFYKSWEGYQELERAMKAFDRNP